MSSLKVFLLGGTKYKSYQKNLIDKGLDVKAVSDLTDSLLETIIDVDKFVIVDKDFDINSNMRVFKKLCTYEFFSTKEIVFIGMEGRDTIEYFDLALSESGKEYKVRRYFDKYININSVYMYIVNMSKGKNKAKNVYKRIYREPFEEKVYPTPEPLTEPYLETDKDTSRLEEYNRIKKQLMFSRDEIINDKIELENKTEVPNLDISEDEVKLKDRFLNVVGVSGERKSGRTVFITALLSSLIKLHKEVLVIDCQENSSTANLINYYYEVDNFNLSEHNNFKDIQDFLSEGDNAVSVLNMNIKDIDIIITIIDEIKEYFDLFSIVIIDLPIFSSKYNSVISLCAKMFFTCSDRKVDVDALANLIGEFDNGTIVVSDVFNSIPDIETYTPKEIRNIFKKKFNKVQVTSKCTLSGLDVDESLALLLLGNILKGDEDEDDGDNQE